MVRVAVVDDDTFYLKMLSNSFAAFFDKQHIDHHITCCLCGEEVIQLMTQEVIDIIILDIDMPQSNGIEVAEQIRKFNNSVIIAFVTNMDHLVFESIKYTPFRFIRKSRLNDELPELLESLQRLFEKKNILYQFADHGMLKQINLNNIMYFESLKHDIMLHDNEGNIFHITEPLNSLFNKYSENGFIKVHKSFLVNYLYIYEINSHFVILDNKEEIPVSKNRGTEIKKQYANITRRNMQ